MDLREEENRDKASSADNAAFLQQAREEAHEDTQHISGAHESMKERIRFLNGDQWDPLAKAERNRDKRPALIFPKLNQFVDGVYGSMLQQRPAITVRPDDAIARGAKAKLDGGKRISMANARAGLMRQINAINQAQIAYLNAYEGAIGWGMGHWRLRIDYKPYSFDKVILIEPIWDPYSVVWDAVSQDIVNRDARRAWIFSEIPKAQFEADYGEGLATSNFSPDTGQSHMSEWIKSGGVVIAERFDRRPKQFTLLQLSDGRVVRYTNDIEAIKDELAKSGVTVINERPDKGWQIEWTKMTGGDVLEGPIVISGESIPVLTVYGRRLWVDGKFTVRALIDNSMDEQRAYNYARTRAIEKVALAPLTPFVAGASQVEGHEHLWKLANTKSLAYLTYNDSENPNAPKREHGASDLSGIRDLIELSERGLMSGIGRYEASLGQRSNETSGRALLARQEQGDQITEPFEENYRYTLTQSATIINDWLPEVYTDGMTAHILNEDGSTEMMSIGAEEVTDEQTGKKVVLNDLAAGRYAIKVDTAPEFTTQRQEQNAGLTEFAQAFPAAASAIAPDVLRTMDIPNAERMARKAEAMLPPEVRQAGDDEEEEGAVPPQVKAAMEQAQQIAEQAQMAVEEAKATIEDLSTAKEDLERKLAAQAEQARLAAERARVEESQKMLALERQLFNLEQRIAHEELEDAKQGKAAQAA